MSLDIAIEEWKALRSEVLGLVDESRNIEKLTIGATGAVYAWLVTKDPNFDSLGILPWYIPLIFSVFGAWRSFVISKHVKAIAEYLKILENKINEEQPKSLGWEKHFESRRGFTFWSALVFWAAMFAITGFLPLFI